MSPVVNKRFSSADPATTPSKNSPTPRSPAAGKSPSDGTILFKIEAVKVVCSSEKNWAMIWSPS
jgi:hypothetical protein